VAELKPLKLTIEEIVHLLSANVVATAWVTTKGAILQTPGVQDVSLIADATTLEATVLVLQGVNGLSAIDSDWNGEELPTCPHGKTYNADWLKHDQLWNHGNCCQRNDLAQPSSA
jgi:hypothetical protein